MKRILLLAVLFSGFTLSYAQEKLPRDQALKYAFYACLNLKDMLSTPIPTDPDVKRPVVVRDGDYGGMVLPESKLTADMLAKAAKEPVAVGQLWMAKLAPVKDGQIVPAGKLKMVHVAASEGEADLPVCALAARKNSDGALELLIYGKEKEPVLTTPLKSVSGAQENPIELMGERTSDGGQITLKFFGKYEAVFMVTDPEQN